ncbi:hypothetical protein PC9H_008377 [Pleurotus ostreatus]|uniref:Uncharacterized protein n=1 Tax=Pleurotus ostreatus TaxID=5322 RepID=A0A8H7DNW8_PLEOS|nr:uncharacterized protein PC9H_008377 [Pleurotus ostreatus]KAF7426014.1 hypothetical protein PC9H_008377 [Pleurotus ostreatus]KAJ8693426.1 hypothetical protein PTI98_008420 [Pleurotus ostreatus]
MFFSMQSSTQPQTSGSMSLPLPATTRTSPSTTTSPIDDFFGSTRGSRHDRRFSVSSNKEDDLPSYSDVEALAPPSYSQRGHKEPVTLAMYLFKFGFLFPPFWILGALILVSDLRSPDAEETSLPSSNGVEAEHLSWLPDKTPAERAAIVQQIRNAEVKWAKRCLAALGILCALGLAAGLAIGFALKQ